MTLGISAQGSILLGSNGILLSAWAFFTPHTQAPKSLQFHALRNHTVHLGALWAKALSSVPSRIGTEGQGSQWWPRTLYS